MSSNASFLRSYRNSLSLELMQTLQYATTSKPDANAVKLLLMANADANFKQHDVRALELCTSSVTVGYLLDAKANTHGALVRAVRSKREALVSALLERKASAVDTDRDEITTMFELARQVDSSGPIERLIANAVHAQLQPLLSVHLTRDPSMLVASFLAPLNSIMERENRRIVTAVRRMKPKQ